MPKHQWTIQTPGEHVVEVQHSIHTARVRVKLDGSLIFSQDGPTALWDSGFSHELLIDGTRWRMEIPGIGTLHPEYALNPVPAHSASAMIRDDHRPEN